MHLTLGQRRFQPGWILTLLTLISLAILISLGTWQVQRLYWKSDLIATMQAQMAAAPVPLPEVSTLDQEGAAIWSYRPVQVQGQFLHDKEVLLIGRSHQGQGGHHLVTPLKTKEGRILLVDRGWIPVAVAKPAQRQQSLINETVTITGILKEGIWHGRDFFKPESQNFDGFITYVNSAELSQHLNLPQLERFYIAAQTQAPQTDWPLSSVAKITVRNNHLQYAFTWFSLAFTLGVIYLLLSFKPINTDQS